VKSASATHWVTTAGNRSVGGPALRADIPGLFRGHAAISLLVFKDLSGRYHREFLLGRFTPLSAGDLAGVEGLQVALHFLSDLLTARTWCQAGSSRSFCLARSSDVSAQPDPQPRTGPITRTRRTGCSTDAYGFLTPDEGGYPPSCWRARRSATLALMFVVFHSCGPIRRLTGCWAKKSEATDSSSSSSPSADAGTHGLLAAPGSPASVSAVCSSVPVQRRAWSSGWDSRRCPGGCRSLVSCWRSRGCRHS